MILEQILMGSGLNFSYIIGDYETKEGAVIDPGSDTNRILQKAQFHNLKIKYIINTHSHGDHTLGNRKLKEKTNAKIIMHFKAPLDMDISVKDEDQLKLGKLNIKVIYTPGHTPDSICLLIDKALFTGDTLFVGECGRTDFTGGNSTDMYNSLFKKILSLEDNIMIYPGHNYGEKPTSTIGIERKTNYTLEPRSLEEFKEFMKEP
jgi:glyoxylase-like metal-dependent hydrolase (beta-lactamase superfamily II)